jgi:hypothetical protein
MRLARKGATRARLSLLIVPSQITHFETLTIWSSYLPRKRDFRAGPSQAYIHSEWNAIALTRGCIKLRHFQSVDILPRWP